MRYWLEFHRRVPLRDISESALETAALVLAMDQVASAMADLDQAFMVQASASAVIEVPATDIRIMVTRPEWLIQAITARPQFTDQHRSIALPIQLLPTDLSRNTKTRVAVAVEVIS